MMKKSESEVSYLGREGRERGGAGGARGGEGEGRRRRRGDGVFDVPLSRPRPRSTRLFTILRL